MWQFSFLYHPHFIQGDDSHSKSASPSTEDLSLIAFEIGPEWRALGQALGLDDQEIQQIELKNEGDLYEQSYAVLIRWMQVKSPVATYELLAKALQHNTVKRTDLVRKYMNWCDEEPSTFGEH